MMESRQTRACTRAIAFYLPQFHPIPENDRWWGPGFTEWTNVTRARPLFRGHDQPRQPADLGYYDLRLAETRAAQVELAASHGIAGFCYWHYWFEGRRLLERPFAAVLDTGEPALPFCLAWANESWSRRWLGEERDLLLAQTYSPADDHRHAEWLLDAFADPRHLRVHGRPLFLVYRPLDLPEPARTTDTLRSVAVGAGLPEPWLVGVDAHCPGVDCRTLGFDDTLDFEPQLGALPGAFDDEPSLLRRLVRAARGRPPGGPHRYDERTARTLMAARRIGRTHPTLPSVFVGWDNSPRRGRAGIVLAGRDPQAFGEALDRALAAVAGRAEDERLVFLNAWNEWAEGNYLEPDRSCGRAFLDQVAARFAAPDAADAEDAPDETTMPASMIGAAVAETSAVDEPAVLFISHDAYPAGAQIALLRLLRWLARRGEVRFHVLLKRGGALEPEFADVADVWHAPADLSSAEAPAVEALRRRLRAADVRLIYANTITNGDLLRVLDCPDVPVVCHVHELDHWIRHRMASDDLAVVRARTERFVAVSQAVRRCLIEVVGVEPARIETICEYLDEMPDAAAAARAGARVRAELGIPADALVVGGCGTTDWRKGTDLFVVLARLVTRSLAGTDVRFLWIGGEAEGPQATALMHDIERAGLGGRLTLLGHRRDALAHLAALDIFALTSREDPFPIVDLEAAALGKPIICFDRAGGAGEFVRGDAGFVVPYLDLAAMSERVVELARSPELRAAMGETGRRRALEEHHLDVVGPRLVELVRGLLGAATL